MTAESHLMPTYAPAPVTFVSGRGCRLIDDTGKEYLDFLSGIAVTTLGHSHPEVVDAICGQVSTLCHVSNLFSNALAPQLAERVDRLVSSAVMRTGGRDVEGRVFFCNSGAEANECAIKLARKRAPANQRTIVSLEGAFHGRTFGALAATAQSVKQAPFSPLPGAFVSVSYDDPAALEGAFSETGVAAVIVEPIQGERGVRPVPPEVFRAARRACDDSGALLIVDEIQTGLGRTGAWFAFEHAGVEPDVVTMAKALGNGMPIGACWARSEIAAVFSPGDHGSTFGGQPLAASAALATLSVIERDGLVERARIAGEQLDRLLRGLEAVDELRGAGMLLGIGLLPGVDAKAVALRALHRGLVVNAIGESTLRLAPPLIVTDEEIQEGVDKLAGALDDVASGLAA